MNWAEAEHRIHKCLVSAEQSSHCDPLLKVRAAADIYRAWYLEQQEGFLAVTEAMLRQWAAEDGISVFDVEEAAEKNDRDAFSVRKLSGILECSGDAGQIIYVVSRKNGILGAAAILDKAVQAELQEIFPDGYYILPCSVHEVLAVPAGMADTDGLLNLVRSINRNGTDAADRLSNHVFAVSHGRLTVVA